MESWGVSSWSSAQTQVLLEASSADHGRAVRGEPQIVGAVLHRLPLPERPAAKRGCRRNKHFYVYSKPDQDLPPRAGGLHAPDHLSSHSGKSTGKRNGAFSAPPSPACPPEKRNGFHATCGRFAPSIAAPIRQQLSSSWCGTSTSHSGMPSTGSRRTRLHSSSVSMIRIESGPFIHPASNSTIPGRNAELFIPLFLSSERFARRTGPATQSLASQACRSIQFVVCRRASSPSTWTRELPGSQQILLVRF